MAVNFITAISFRASCCMNKTASRVFNIVSNKYIIATMAFVLMMLFFDDNNIFLQLDRKRQINNLLKSKAFYEAQIANTQQTLKDLQSSPASVEKYAREKFLIKRDNEDVFIVETPSNKK